MDRDDAIANAHAYFDTHSGWAPPDEDTLAEWAADGMCRAPDECATTPGGWCRHGIASWALVLADPEHLGRRRSAPTSPRGGESLR